MKWTYKIMKSITSLLGAVCFCSALYFGLCGGPLYVYTQSETVSQKSKADVKKDTKKKKKVKVKTKTQVAIFAIKDRV